MDNITKQNINNNFELGMYVLNKHIKYNPNDLSIPCNKEVCDKIKEEYINYLKENGKAGFDPEDEQYQQKEKEFVEFFNKSENNMLKECGYMNLKIYFHLFSSNKKRFSVDFRKFYVNNDRKINDTIYTKHIVSRHVAENSTTDNQYNIVNDIDFVDSNVELDDDSINYNYISQNYDTINNVPLVDSRPVEQYTADKDYYANIANYNPC